MNATPVSQIPGDPATTLDHQLRTIARRHQWDSLNVAMAYASVGGYLRLLEALDAPHRTFTSKWLIGLDDYLTHPGVLKVCRRMPGAELRVARLTPHAMRFHPKAILFASSDAFSLAFIGSNNLTMGGLKSNCETYVHCAVESPADHSALTATWSRVWEIGEVPSDEYIAHYESEYRRHHPSDSGDDSVGDSGEVDKEIIVSDEPHLDPALADTCWIEVGKNTAMGRELEFKAEQALFFGLNPTGGPPHYATFIVSDGTLTTLCLVYRKSEPGVRRNSMWRLQMNKIVPEVAVGLRPRIASTNKLGRSPFVAVFQRADNPDGYFLRFIRDDSAEYEELRRRSARAGTIARTSTRRYGWC